MIMKWLMKKLLKIIKKYGMKMLLEALITLTLDRAKDPYERRLAKDLQTALDNYSKRYDD